jgi:hypothetical protein
LVDVGAANRFITAAVTDLSEQQKAALKQTEQRSADDRASKRRRPVDAGRMSPGKEKAGARQSASVFLDEL